MRNLQLWLRYQWDRVAAVIAVALGALAMLLGWIGASSTPHPAEQIPYVISGGMFGIFMLGLGVMLWLSADLRDNWRKLSELQAQRDVAGDVSLAGADTSTQGREVVSRNGRGRPAAVPIRAARVPEARP